MTQCDRISGIAADSIVSTGRCREWPPRPRDTKARGLDVRRSPTRIFRRDGTARWMSIAVGAKPGCGCGAMPLGYPQSHAPARGTTGGLTFAWRWDAQREFLVEDGRCRGPSARRASDCAPAPRLRAFPQPRWWTRGVAGWAITSRSSLHRMKECAYKRRAQGPENAMASGPARLGPGVSRISALSTGVRRPDRCRSTRSEVPPIA